MTQSFRYTNPITAGEAMSLRDHQITRVGDTWYLTGTSQPIWGGKNPGVKLFRSRDLLVWEPLGLIVDATTLPDDGWFNGRFWAPEIHAAHGRFWLTVNSGGPGPDGDPRRMFGHAIVLFVADRIEGPYTLVTHDRPIGKPFKNDASLFTEDDGRTYLYCSGGGLWQSEIDLPTGRLIGGDDLAKICGPRDAGNPDWMIGGIEGPYVVKRHGFYWMFFSAWTRGYEIGVMRASAPLGPWTLWPREPVFGVRKRGYRLKQAVADGYAHLEYDDTTDPFVEVGHCAVFEGPDGNDWLCGHYFTEGRILLPDTPVPEYADSWPQLGIEPLRFDGTHWHVDGPTWSEQTISL